MDSCKKKNVERSTNDEGGDEGAEESECEDGADVPGGGG